MQTSTGDPVPEPFCGRCGKFHRQTTESCTNTIISKIDSGMRNLYDARYLVNKGTSKKVSIVRYVK
jgi:hypothetical protein